MFDFLTNKFSALFSALSGKGAIDEAAIEQTMEKVCSALIEADVPYQVAHDFVAAVKKEIKENKPAANVKMADYVIKVVYERLKSFLGSQTAILSYQIPSVVMVMGLQGSGKTTTLAKMAYNVCDQAAKRGKKREVLLASVDFTRPAAIDQLEQLAARANIAFYRAKSNDPEAAAREIYAYFKQGGFELLFLDTAGRLHVEASLLEQLRTIEADLKPRYKMLVLDAMTGQESLSVARAFEQGVGYQYAILTKMDSDTRGGAAFAFAYDQKKPIVFVGIGEKLADLEPFHPDRMASSILGMGDVQSLVERMEQSLNAKDHESAQMAFMQGKMTLADFADQLDMMNKVGSLSSLARYMPAFGGMKLDQGMLEKGEQELKKFKAIINSMTPKERLYPRILDAPRKKRVAQGAGVTVADVSQLLTRFEETLQYAKLFKKMWRKPFA